MMETVIITGGTGLIGSQLNQLLLQNGYAVINFSRSAKNKTAAPPVAGESQDVFWDPANKIIDNASIAQADYIINLAGAGVADKRWTDKRKSIIVSSRVQSGHLIVESLKQVPNKVQLVINSSGIGWYGADPEIPNPQPFTENLPHDKEFLGQTCLEWEKSVEGVTALGNRLVIFRTGIVLSTKGGALKEFIRPLNFGVATILGSGKQMMSWIHVDDICKMFLFAIKNKQVSGVYNAATPHPVSNRQLILQLAKTRNKFYIPFVVPSFVLKIVLGELSIEVLKSATVSVQKIQDAGFDFTFPGLEQAIGDLIA